MPADCYGGLIPTIVPAPLHVPSPFPALLAAPPYRYRSPLLSLPLFLSPLSFCSCTSTLPTLLPSLPPLPAATEPVSAPSSTTPFPAATSRICRTGFIGRRSRSCIACIPSRRRRSSLDDLSRSARTAASISFSARFVSSVRRRSISS